MYYIKGNERRLMLINKKQIREYIRKINDKARVKSNFYEELEGFIETICREHFKKKPNKYDHLSDMEFVKKYMSNIRGQNDKNR